MTKVLFHMVFTALLTVMTDRGVPLGGWSILGKSMSNEDQGAYMQRYGWFRFPRSVFAALAVALAGLNAWFHQDVIVVAAVASLALQGAFSGIDTVRARRLT